ncbi:hypothetical protein [Corynebacterium pelargi]|uniref:Uncharacterized protein n=1 Tax=Corynebacterium pelargi TaxID=1471400 RepID=A0A410W9K4_9CORY|nr:hypothetical protein [Corynebacterium pelargi]QAU52638.1 hypothetical protein CPELA_06880 [Corynebacterium pelargi]GGG77819.1 hypothetical protein GCM10007338_14670 [Corynebacterium pelargi]
MGIFKKAASKVGDRFLFSKKDNTADADLDNADLDTLAENSGATGKALLRTLDRAAKMQSSAIVNYVEWLRSKNQDATPEQIQQKMDKHFKMLVTGTGAGAGGAAAVPGVGFFTGAAAIAAESLAFLDAAAFYTMASGYLRGGDVRDPERRKSLILIAILGSEGSALVDASIGATSSVAALSRMSARNVTKVNNRMTKLALKQVTKRLKYSWMGKIMPLGIGVVIGTVANRKIAKRVIENTQQALGPAPEQFDTPAPAEGSIEEPKATISSNESETEQDS